MSPDNSASHRFYDMQQKTFLKKKVLILFQAINITKMLSSTLATFLPPGSHIDGITPEERMRQNEIFQESSSNFFDCLAVYYYHISMKLPEITKCYSIWKACCFRWYHSFSKILIHIDITVHTPFWNWRLPLLYITTYEQFI